MSFHQNHARGFVWTAILLVGTTFNISASVSVLTYHNDAARTGQNTNETVLNLSNVNTNNFGKLFSYAVDGYVYAQPLIVTNVTIPGKGIHNVLYVATEHDSVYAFDADNNAGSNSPPLWQVSFINPSNGVTTVSSSDPNINCTDLVPEIGITSTPVIDPISGTIYIVAKTKEIVSGVTNYFYRLHALDITDGGEKPGGPVVIQASVAGSGAESDGAGHLVFDPIRELNRMALLLNNGMIYFGFSSHCGDGGHGWLFAYNAQTLAFSNAFCSTPNGELGGIWEDGDGPAGDASDNVYISSGNGTFDGTANNDYGDSILKFSNTNALQLVDYFTPFDADFLFQQDLDLASGGVILLPDEAGTVTNQHLLIGAGKEGKIYLVDRDDMGHFQAGSDSQIVQSIPNAVGNSSVGNIFCTPAYFNYSIYYLGVNDGLKVFNISNAMISPTPASQSANKFGYPGSTPSVSADGTSDAIIWVINSHGYKTNGPSVLYAYNATNAALELYNSQADGGGRDNPGGAVKFTVPTVANGKVYVGAEYAVSVFGIGIFLPAPVITPNGGTFAGSVSVTLTDAIPDAALYYTLDNSVPTTNSILYLSPFIITNSLEIKVKAVKVGIEDSTVTMAIFISGASIGNGVGLSGEYFSNQLKTFTNPPTLIRTDATVNFNWGTGSPDPTISTDLFTVRWTGTVQPQFNENYTFYTSTDDGVRLWVNGQLLINEWINQSATEWSGSISLVAGQKYPITMEYYEDTSLASAQLSWSSPSTGKAIVPQSQLYPTYGAIFAPSASSFTNGSFQMQLSGLVGKNYALQTTTNFTTWITIMTNFSPPDPNITLPTNVFYFIDPNATNFPFRFYRGVEQP